MQMNVSGDLRFPLMPRLSRRFRLLSDRCSLLQLVDGFRRRKPDRPEVELTSIAYIRSEVDCLLSLAL
jgi:hypothetical protein